MNGNQDKNHYFGILADWYDRLLVDEKNDIDYYVPLVTGRGGRALELACGTGRLLVLIRKSGIEIDGVDISSEMLAHCKTKLDSLNLKSGLFEQDIVSFKTEKTYDTIFISGGSFCMIDDFNEAQKCIQNIYEHLNNNGVFVLDIFKPTQDAKSDSEGTETLMRTAQSGDQKLVCFGNTKYDFEEQVLSGSYSYELHSEDAETQIVKDTFKMRWYGKYEFKLMLESAGFKNIEIESADIMSSHSRTLIYRAYK